MNVVQRTCRAQETGMAKKMYSSIKQKTFTQVLLFFVFLSETTKKKKSTEMLPFCASCVMGMAVMVERR